MGGQGSDRAAESMYAPTSRSARASTWSDETAKPSSDNSVAAYDWNSGRSSGCHGFRVFDKAVSSWFDIVSAEHGLTEDGKTVPPFIYCSFLYQRHIVPCIAIIPLSGRYISPASYSRGKSSRQAKKSTVHTTKSHHSQVHRRERRKFRKDPTQSRHHRNPGLYLSMDFAGWRHWQSLYFTSGGTNRNRGLHSNPLIGWLTRHFSGFGVVCRFCLS